MLVADGRENFQESMALARLFSPELSDADLPLAQPVWRRSLLAFPGGRSGQINWPETMAAFYGLAGGGPKCVVASLKSLCLRYMPRNFFDAQTIDIALGQELSPDLIMGQALEWGYERAQMVVQPGEMARRGDILDIFPAGYAKPLRIEFFGDNIEEIRMFDADTQRSLENLDEFELVPAAPVVFNPQAKEAIIGHLGKLAAGGRLNENEEYEIRKAVEQESKTVWPGVIYPEPSFFEKWLPQDALWIIHGEADMAEQLLAARASLQEEIEGDSVACAQPGALALRRPAQAPPWNGFQCAVFEKLHMGIEEKGLALPERAINSFAELFPREEDKDRPWQAVVMALKSWGRKYSQVLLGFGSDRKRRKFLKLAEQDGIFPLLKYAPAQEGLYALVAPLNVGLELEWDKLLLLGEEILYPKSDRRQRKASAAFKGLENFSELQAGDLLVHRDYGIGRYVGLESLTIDNIANDFLLIEYSGNDRLYVPADRLGLVQKFRGQGGVEPALDRLGAQSWAQGKEKARKAIEKIAADLVKMYARRKVAKGFKYGPPDELYREFEATFAFEETPDQALAIQDVLTDMEKPSPMDRLVCGDVGFGKTEIAIRAAFRAASEGRQVALLCPTTVLAEQHYQTFRSRLAGFPINVGLLSRFVPPARQKEVLKACEQGQIDILIGTHRILSKDVKLPNLALLILDEEQRFGVRHKEKLKELRQNVDVLTLTATPIPRTLQLSMSGIRDLSIIETAPVDRKPVATAVIERNAETLRKVLERELAREGQVFWVYNRVEGLEEVAEYVKKLAPGARVGMAHGKLPEKQLETVMREFWHGELDILVCTSIVESGLDFPRANTLIVDQAQMFGLGQLYQLRGRVGRSDRQAYAFLVTPRRMTDIAQERMRIIMNMDYLGAGFQVAMEDLRLRGAGNILGEAQSGHMTRVGLDLYLDMLEQEVSRQKGEEHLAPEPELNIAVAAHIPEAYIEDGRERLRFYKALTSAPDGAGREEVALAMRDRFGPLPEELRNFLAILDFKQFLTGLQVEKADINKDSLRLAWNKSQTAIDPSKLAQLVASEPAVKIQPPATLLLAFANARDFVENLKKARGILKDLACAKPEKIAQDA